MNHVSAAVEGSKQKEKRVPVEADFWLLIFGDLMVFGAMFVAFMVRRFESEETYLAFSNGAQSLNQTIGLSNTLILLSSSFFVASALSHFRAGKMSIAKKQIQWAILCGLGFATLKLYEYWEKIDQGLGVTSSRFYEFYFTFTGVHLLHVVIGIGLLVFIRLKTKNQLSAPSEGFVEGVGCYWHMVDLLWLMLFSLFYLLA